MYDVCCVMDDVKHNTWEGTVYDVCCIMSYALYHVLLVHEVNNMKSQDEVELHRQK